jgi:hypothetical protein
MTRKAVLKSADMPRNAANKKCLLTPPQRNDPVGAQIEQLPDRSGFLKFPSQPAWIGVSFPYYDVPKVAEPFVAATSL